MSTVAQPIWTVPLATEFPIATGSSISFSWTWNSPPLASFQIFFGALPPLAQMIGAQPAHTLTANLTTRGLPSDSYAAVPGTSGSVVAGSNEYSVTVVGGAFGSGFSAVAEPAEPFDPPFLTMFGST